MVALYHKGLLGNVTEDSPMPRLRSFLTVFLLLCCLIPLGAPLGMVLCFGADGHIALEPAHDQSRRATSWGLLCQQAVQGLAGVEHPVPCADVAFSATDGSAPMLSVSEASPKPEAPVLVPVLFVVPASPVLPPASIFPDHSLRINPSLTSLRSVMLHI
jgi:hypothetical protein